MANKKYTKKDLKKAFNAGMYYVKDDEESEFFPSLAPNFVEWFKNFKKEK